MREITCRSRRLLAGPCFQIVYCFLILVLCLPTASRSQAASFTPEVFGGISLGHLSMKRIVSEPLPPRNRRTTLDRSAGFNAGFGLRHRSGWGLEIEFSHVLDPSPGLLECDDFSEYAQPCHGSGRTGPDSYSLVSANAVYHFSTSRFQPYVAGGLGAEWFAGFDSQYFPLGKFAGLTESFISEGAWKHTGAVWNVGGGMRIFLSSVVSLRPDIRLYHAPLPYGRKLRLLRSSIIFGYHW